jgi:hypothetical protein
MAIYVFAHCFVYYSLLRLAEEVCCVRNEAVCVLIYFDWCGGGCHGGSFTHVFSNVRYLRIRGDDSMILEVPKYRKFLGVSLPNVPFELVSA